MQRINESSMEAFDKLIEDTCSPDAAELMKSYQRLENAVCDINHDFNQIILQHHAEGVELRRERKEKVDPLLDEITKLHEELSKLEGTKAFPITLAPLPPRNDSLYPRTPDLFNAGVRSSDLGCVQAT